MAKAKTTSTELKTEKTTNPRTHILKTTASSLLRNVKQYKPKSYIPILATLLVFAAFLLGVLITKVQYLENGLETNIVAQNDQTGTTGDTVPPVGQKVDVGVGHLPLLGNKNAKVTVIEFADFQCPYCKQFFTQVEANIIKDYVNTGKVQFAFRHYPFLGQESTDASNASECANDQGKFWEYHDYLYQNQGRENAGDFSKDKLKGFAATLGLDTAQFNNCLDANKNQANLDKDLSEGQAAGVNGTPATFVNGILISGAAPYADFKAQIDKALAE